MRSIDVVFFENQTIEDLDKDEKPTTSQEYPVNFDSIPPPVVHDEYGGDEQDDGGVDDTLATEDVEQEMEEEQVPLEPSEEPQLRRSN